MLVFKLKDSIPFSAREKAVFTCLCECWLRYNPKIASFLYMIMGKDPSETDYKLDFSNINIRWTPVGENYVLGSWSIVTPNTLYIGAHHIHNVDNYQGEIPEGFAPDAPIRTRIDKFELVIGEIMTAFPIVMHEFYHMFQFKGCPVGFIAMRFVTLFSKFPYYLHNVDKLKFMFPDGEQTAWLQTWNKWTEWDLEGQAEKYGNKAEGLEKFLKELGVVYHAYMFQRNLYKTYKRNLSKYGKDHEETISSKKFADEYVIESCSDASPVIFEMGTTLFNVYKKYTTKK